MIGNLIKYCIVPNVLFMTFLFPSSRSSLVHCVEFMIHTNKCLSFTAFTLIFFFIIKIPQILPYLILFLRLRFSQHFQKSLCRYLPRDRFVEQVKRARLSLLEFFVFVIYLDLESFQFQRRTHTATSRFRVKLQNVSQQRQTMFGKTDNTNVTNPLKFQSIKCSRQYFFKNQNQNQKLKPNWNS